MASKQSSGQIHIDISKGFRPHFAPTFLDAFGQQSRFTLATADLLTARHAAVLRNVNALSSDDVVAQLGHPEAVSSLELLLSHLKARGADVHFLHLLRESTGVVPPGGLEREVDSFYGEGAFAQWLILFQDGNFAAADLTIGALH